MEIARVFLNGSEIYYCTRKLRVVRFQLNGELLYDEKLEITIPGWYEQFLSFCEHASDYKIIGWSGESKCDIT